MELNSKKVKDIAARRMEYLSNLKRTLLPIAIGVLLGIISLSMAKFISNDYRRVGPLILVLILIGIYIHRYTLPLITPGHENLAPKDWIYIGFMVFITWFVSFTLLLN
ncbi:MAG: hypothetical protein QXL78_06310 [Methanocellales archaeon]